MFTLKSTIGNLFDMLKLLNLSIYLMKQHSKLTVILLYILLKGIFPVSIHDLYVFSLIKCHLNSGVVYLKSSVICICNHANTYVEHELKILLYVYCVSVLTSF